MTAKSFSGPGSFEAAMGARQVPIPARPQAADNVGALLRAHHGMLGRHAARLDDHDGRLSKLEQANLGSPLGSDSDGDSDADMS